MNSEYQTPHPDPRAVCSRGESGSIVQSLRRPIKKKNECTPTPAPFLNSYICSLTAQLLIVIVPLKN